MAHMSVMIDKNLSIFESDYSIVFVRSSGPGGQNVNKTASKAQLRFNIAGAEIPLPVKERLYKIARKRINDKGELVIEAQRYRNQEQNRQDAIDRLVSLLRLASIEPPARLKTRPTLQSRRKRLQAKQRRGQTKRLRRRPSDDLDYS